MPEFRAATRRELNSLRALMVAQRQFERHELRLTVKRARVRVAGALRAVRGSRTFTDMQWHASVTEREARALRALSRGIKMRRLLAGLIQRAAQSLER